MGHTTIPSVVSQLGEFQIYDKAAKPKPPVPMATSGQEMMMSEQKLLQYFREYVQPSLNPYL